MVVIYLRVSTEEQEKSGLGLGAQQKACEDYCRINNLNVLTTCVDVLSGKINPSKRTGFSKAIDMAVLNKCPIVVSTQDRFSRSMLHICQYIEGEMYGKKTTPKLIFVDNPNCTELEIHCKAMISQQERRLISKRTKDALADLKRKKPEIKLGEAGQRAFKAKVDAKIKDAMDIAFNLRREGRSYQYIADRLNEAGLTNSVGGVWRADMVYRRMKVREVEFAI